MKGVSASRDIVPIWKTSRDAAKSLEVKSLKAPVPLDGLNGQGSKILLAEFESNRSLGVAADLLNIALLEGDQDALKISAEFVFSHELATPELLRISGDILGNENNRLTDYADRNISALRTRLKENSNNPLAWADLARAYAIINEKDKAQRAMLVALRYASHHRWVCRAASRLFVHFEEPGQALRLLHQNPNLKQDPWLLSTELAVSRLASRPLKNWGQAKKLAESSINPVHLSELASSIGTSEILGGADKKAKNYFRQALISPNSNSLAQVKWADRSFNLGFSKQIVSSLQSVSSAFEARHWEAYERKDIVSAIEYAKQWWEEEPYSTSPPQAIGYMGSLLNDVGLVYENTKVALERNPTDITLKLNDIYARACLFGFDERVKFAITEKDISYLKSIMSGEDKDYAAHAYANAGLICYRLGALDKGREFYDGAKQYFEKKRDDAVLFLIINHYREALISGASWSAIIEDELRLKLSGAKTVTSPAAEFYLQQIDRLVGAPGNWDEKLSKPFAVLPGRPSVLRAEEKKPLVGYVERFWLPDDFITQNGLKILLGTSSSGNKNKK
ncbi:hypothetical protein EI969_17590 [Pseudomonas sp. PB101]|uniref:hypothetical protein n=1 Tax=Pseudomonas sp. PB101 TaxID=2495428 RepID=UPI0013655548|nr:hypothetical protein [Pseudomonas sp. PB101]MVW87732.1 hypothetical protein [Pseudomonas sp. PB101]